MLRPAEQLDVIDLAAIAARDTVAVQGLPDPPGDFGEAVDILKGDALPVIVDQEKPVAAPGDIASDPAVAIHFHHHLPGGPKAGNILHRHLARIVECGFHNAYGRLNPVLAGLDSTQVSQSRHQPDRAVAAHSQISDIVEEDDAG